MHPAAGRKHDRLSSRPDRRPDVTSPAASCWRCGRRCH